MYPSAFITFNYRDEPVEATIDDIIAAANNSSDIDCIGSPTKNLLLSAKTKEGFLNEAHLRCMKNEAGLSPYEACLRHTESNSALRFIETEKDSASCLRRIYASANASLISRRFYVS